MFSLPSGLDLFHAAHFSIFARHIHHRYIHFSWIYAEIFRLYVVSDVPVDDEASVMTSKISKSIGVQSFGSAHRGRVCVRVFIRVSVGACCELVVPCNSKKTVHSLSFCYKKNMYIYSL
jgi:hypothetical protein